ncbi:MAG: hypothetical protein ACOYO0_04170 [Sandarakinorhabdus sp.]
MSSGIFLSFPAVAGFSRTFRAELAEYVQAQTSATVDTSEDGGPVANDDEEEPADLSVAQAKKFLDRVSDKVRTTLRVIAESDNSGFDMARVKEALGVGDDTDLRGVWGGITKRVRTVLGDDEANLIWWTQKESGDWIGRVSPMTHRSFSKVLGL